MADDKRILSEEAKALVAQIAGCQNLVEIFVNMVLEKVHGLEERILELEKAGDKEPVINIQTQQEVQKPVGSKGMCWITDGVHDKMVRAEEQFPDGWGRGRTNCKLHKESTSNGELKSRKEHIHTGTIWITNGIKDMRVKEVDEIPDGYTLGRKRRENNGPNITTQ